MNYWLMKSEPETWSWADQVKKNIECWDGVRSYQASNNMKAMRLKDRAFFYHSGRERRIMGIVQIAKEYYPDHTDDSGRFGMVDVQTIEPFKIPVSLQSIKQKAELAHLALVRQSRLSVMPIDADAWQIILKMGQGHPPK